MIVCFFLITEVHPATILLWIRDKAREIKNSENEYVKDFENNEKPKIKKPVKLKIDDVPNEIPIEKFDLANQIGIDEVKDGKVEEGEKPILKPQEEVKKEEVKAENKKPNDNEPIPTINIDTVEPEPELVAKYEDRYAQFKEIYPTCKPLFEKLL